MEKLSTDKLKKLITQWLSTLEIENDLKGYYTQDLDQKELDYISNELGLDKNLTAGDIDCHIFKLFSNGSQWSRENKEKLKEEWKSYFYTNPKPEFAYDFAGNSDINLVTEFCNKPKEAEKCILRVFVPKNDHLGNNFRLEIVTKPDDTEVVGWTVMVD